VFFFVHPLLLSPLRTGFRGCRSASVELEFRSHQR
jgi:hypothetical protein